MSSPEGVQNPASKLSSVWASSPLALKKWIEAGVSGLGGFLVIFLLAQLTQSLHALLLIAPFGASCVLVFALPQTPVAQPRNLIGGHLISTAVGLAVFALLGASPLSYALAVGAAIAAMQLTGTLHPPAGADPIVGHALEYEGDVRAVARRRPIVRHAAVESLAGEAALAPARELRRQHI